MIKAHIVEHLQGSPEWKQHRAKSLNASELAAVMGVSPYQTRAELIAVKATGVAPEISEATQRIFDNGHSYEAAARAMAEEIIGEDLYPVVLAAEVDGLPLSASLDGQTIAGDVTWEHKSANVDLMASLEMGVIPDAYHPQIEQGLMLSGASKCLFMASNGTKEKMRYAWYESNPQLRAMIVPTWKQFQADVAAYVPTEAKPRAAGKTMEALPALVISVSGEVTQSNLGEFKTHALAVFDGVNRDLVTDQDFADAENAVKWCSDVESRLKAAKDHALSQASSIHSLLSTLDEITDEARKVRLELDKLVKARKEAIKREIVAGGLDAYRAHMKALNEKLGQPLLSNQYEPDFAEAIKGKRTVDSIQNAVDTALANAKTQANMLAERVTVNLETIKAQNPALFPDYRALVFKEADDLAAIIELRIAAHAAQEREKQALKELQAQRIEQVIAMPDPTAAKVIAAAAVALAQSDSQKTVQSEKLIKLGDINQRLGLPLTTETLVSFGIRHVAHERAAKLYRESDLALLCDALIERIERVKESIQPVVI